MLILAYTYVFFILVYVLVDYEIFEKNYKSVVEIDSSLIKFVHSWLFKYGLNLVAGIQRKKRQQMELWKVDGIDFFKHKELWGKT